MSKSACCLAASIVLAVSSARAQQYTIGPDGQKVPVLEEIGPDGKPINSQPTVIPPPAPLVGGADSCVTPDLAVGLGPFSWDTNAATTGTQGQAEQMCYAFATTAIVKDVWFTWNATFTGLARVDLCALTTLDSRLAVYPGNTCPANGTALACDDDACITNALNSKTNFYCTAGADYVIQIGGYSTGGSGTFTINAITGSPGDDCAAPVTVVGAGPFPFDTENATTGTQGQAEALCGAGGAARIPRDVWFVWNATFTGVAQARTCSGTTINTKLAVYAGNTCPSAAALACNDDSCGTQSAANFACTMGQDYIIQLGMFVNGSDPGTGTFTIANASPPPEDSCTTPLTVVGTGPFPFDTTFSTTGTQGQTEPLCGAGTAAAIPKDNWYVWNATFSGSAGARTCGGTTLNTKIAVYAGNACPGAPALGCDDNFCGTQSMAIFACTTGQDYLIQLGLNNAVTTGGTGTWEIIGVSPPANDDCSTPTNVVGLGLFPFDDTFATTGTQGQTEPLCGAGAAAAIQRDVWFTWNSTLTGPVAISTLGNGNTLNTKIAVYDGAGCPGAAALACNDNVTVTQSMAVFSAVAGQNYTFQIGLNNAVTSGGTGTFEIMDASTPASDDCATPQPLSGPGPFAFNTYFTTTGTAGQSGSPCTFTNGINYDQWFVWTPTMSGSVTVSTCGGTVGQPSNDTKLAAYPAGACPAASGAALACNDDTTCPGGISTFNSAITFNTTCGQSYLIQVGRYIPTTAPIRGQFTISETGSTCNPGVGYCFGDGSGNNCPCSTAIGGTEPPGAPGNGCPNSINPSGANLVASGLASVAADSVALQGSGMPNATCLYFQGTARFGPGGNGAAFGDGLRCAGGIVIRLGIKTNVGGTSQYPVAGDQSISMKGLIPPAGGLRDYQCWYRNSALYCIANATFNLTNGVEINWAP
jgi:hypothetical protein